MGRRLWAAGVGIAALVAALIVVSPARRDPPSPAAALDRPGEEEVPPASSATPPELVELLAARQPKEYQRAAARLQAACRTDPSLIRTLAALLLDPKADPNAREVAAFVLGSLDAPEAVQALLKALEAGGSASWVRTLVLALGSARDKGRDYTFGYAGGPHVVHTASGLGVEIRAVIGDAAVRTALEGRLGHEDLEVRRAALQSLETTLIAGPDVPDVREAFLRSMKGDLDESLRAIAARALSEWLIAVPGDTPELPRVAGQIVRKSLEPEEDQLRFRVLPGLRQGALPKAELDLIYEQALRGEREPRLWAIEIAAAHVEGQRQSALFATALRDPDGKVRETAVRQLGRVKPTAETAYLARLSLGDSAWNVRCEAIRSLGRGPADPETLRALEETSRSDPNRDVRTLAESTLRILRRR